MMACLDTSFIVDFVRGDLSHEKVDSLFLENPEISIPSPVIVELTKGLHLNTTSSNIRKNESQKIEDVLSKINVLPLDKESAEIAGKVEAKLTNQGEKIGIEDVLIASIAIKNNEKLITKNEKHFSKINGLEVKEY